MSRKGNANENVPIRREHGYKRQVTMRRFSRGITDSTLLYSVYSILDTQHFVYSGEIE
jgi:hypothetical protein